MCPTCGKPLAACACGRPDPVGDAKSVVRVRMETKGRKGKSVTVITGVPMGPAELSGLGKQLKKRCSSGGTVKEGTIEIQGDHCDTVVRELEDRGWTVKRSGG